MVLHLELELTDPVDERHERRGIHEALELNVERIEDMFARLHREQFLHSLRGPVPPPPRPVERLVQREDAGHLHVMPQLLDAHPLLRERDRVELVTRRIGPMNAFDDLLVEPGERAVVELLVYHAVLLNRTEFRRGLRADDL